MPNIKSAKKRVKQSAVNEVRNRSERSRVTTARRKFTGAIESGDSSAMEESYREFCSVVDKAAKHGIIKKNTADRKKGRAAIALRKAG